MEYHEHEDNWQIPKRSLTIEEAEWLAAPVVARQVEGNIVLSGISYAGEIPPTPVRSEVTDDFMLTKPA